MVGFGYVEVGESAGEIDGIFSAGYGCSADLEAGGNGGEELGPGIAAGIVAETGGVGDPDTVGIGGESAEEIDGAVEDGGVGVVEGEGEIGGSGPGISV